ncbi:MAG: hypothetical protein QM765_16290 [Myxococcales bacterium]
MSWGELFWAARAELSVKRGQAIPEVTACLGGMLGVRLATTPAPDDHFSLGAVKDLLDFLKKA